MAVVDTTNIPNESLPYSESSNSGTEKLVNGQIWEIEVKFNNYSGQEYTLPTSIILNLNIEDDCLRWFTKGYIIYHNIHEGLERASETTGTPLYVYRMDARDEITITIKPITDSTTGTSELPTEIWERSYTFVVYDSEDLPASNIASKVKKLYFWDKLYQQALDKNLQWSTATAQGLTNVAHLTDSERSMKTGLALQQLLIDAGFQDKIDFDNWEEGKNSIFYTSPSDSNVVDDVNYLLSKHISTKGDRCLLISDSKTKLLQLIPLYKFFEKAGKSASSPGELQLEHLFFETLAEEADTTPYKAPYLNDVSFENDIKMTEWNKISTYFFVDMAGIDNAQQLISKPVYWYDNTKKQFGMNYKKNEISEVKTKFQELYTKNVYAAKEGEAYPLFTLNTTKTNQVNVHPKFSFKNYTNYSDKSSLNNLGRGETLFAGLFLNECIHLTLVGSTHRHVATFIGIDREAATDNEFDYKVCGQWFVIRVNIIFFHNKFINEVIAVKAHAYKELSIEEGVE